MKKAQLSGVMLGILITVIMAMIVIQVVFSLIEAKTTTTAVTGDQFTPQNQSCVRLTTECLQRGTLSVVNASTGKVLTGNFTECGTGNDLFGAVGNFIGCDECDQIQNASYTEVDCQPLPGGLTTTIINYLPLLLAVVILVFVAGYIGVKGG